MNYQLQHIPPSEQRREGNTWHGGRTPYPKASVEHASADLVLNAWLGRFTAYVSPAALAVAWQDWAGHLRLSPDKQVELGCWPFPTWSAGYNIALAPCTEIRRSPCSRWPRISASRTRLGTPGHTTC
jgi:hypothetical protein